MHLHHSNLRSTLSTTASSCVRPETSTPRPACQHSTTASEPKLKPLAVDLKLLAVALPPSAAAGPAVVAGFERRVPAWPKVPEDPTSRPALLDCARSCCKAASRAAATLLHSRFDRSNVSIPGATQRCKGLASLGCSLCPMLVGGSMELFKPCWLAVLLPCTKF
jgi:hypothetical protein